MLFFKDLEIAAAPRAPDKVFADLDAVFSGDWQNRKDEVARLMLELRADYNLLRTFAVSIATAGKWPDLNGAQSYYVYQTDAVVVRMNLWFPYSSKNPAIDTLRRYLSIEELHNHDFQFFTICLLGSGYRTHFYRDRDWSPDRVAGELLDLSDEGVHALNGTDVLFVDKNLDYHLQHWPDTFSVTLNVIPANDPASDKTQYILDKDSLRIKYVARL
jgi:hypothetical protein